MNVAFRSLLLAGAVGLCLTGTSFAQTGNCPTPPATAGAGTAGIGLGAFLNMGRGIGALPPGLASRTTLPPGLAVRGTLPPGLLNFRPGNPSTF